MIIANERSRVVIYHGISSGRLKYLDDLDYADVTSLLQALTILLQACDKPVTSFCKSQVRASSQHTMESRN